MEVERRKLKRKPLSDCTNIAASLTRTSKTASNPKKKADENSIKYDTSTGSNNAENPSLPSQPSTPLPQKRSANSVTADYENLKTATVYRRRRSVENSKDKGKQVVVDIPLSCPPARRIGNLGDDLSSKHGNRNELNGGKEDVYLFNTAPRPKNNKKRHFSMAEQHALPQDFIDKQKAYFAEIDAFELPEEVVSESELE